MRAYRGDTADKAWQDILQIILGAGNFNIREVTSRGLTYKEVLAGQSEINMQYPVVKNKTRCLGYKFMAAEAYWILTGDDRVSTIQEYAPNIVKYSDNGYRFAGAYGPKIQDQLCYVCDTLISDPGSRQAVMTIWRENPAPSKDIPCTISAQFLIRDGLLYCIDTMRSSDTWLGWPYDVFNFTMLSALVYLMIHKVIPASLGGLGTLTMQCGSQHLYLENVEPASACIKWAPIESDFFFFDVSKFSSPLELLQWLNYCRRTGCLKDDMEVLWPKS